MGESGLVSFEGVFNFGAKCCELFFKDLAIQLGDDLRRRSVQDRGSAAASNNGWMISDWRFSGGALLWEERGCDLVYGVLKRAETARVFSVWRGGGQALGKSLLELLADVGVCEAGEVEEVERGWDAAIGSDAEFESHDDCSVVGAHESRSMKN